MDERWITSDRKLPKVLDDLAYRTSSLLGEVEEALPEIRDAMAGRGHPPVGMDEAQWARLMFRQIEDQLDQLGGTARRVRRLLAKA